LKKKGKGKKIPKDDKNMIYEGKEELYCHVDSYPGILNVFLQNLSKNEQQIMLYPHFHQSVNFYTKIPTIKLESHQFTNFQFIYSSNEIKVGKILCIFHENERELLLCKNDVKVSKIQNRDLFFYRTYNKIYPLIESRQKLLRFDIYPFQINEMLANTKFKFQTLNHRYKDNILTWISFNPFIFINLKNPHFEVYCSKTEILDEIEKLFDNFKGISSKFYKKYKYFFELGVSLSTISDYITIKWDVEPTLQKLLEISDLLKNLNINFPIDTMFNKLKSKKSLNDMSNSEINELNQSINHIYTQIRTELGEIM